MKICKDCNTEKPFKDYYENYNGKPSPYCKFCYSARMRARYWMKKNKASEERNLMLAEIALEPIKYTGP